METPQKPTVLFLEDDADTRELVKFTLEAAGMKVISAETVSEAWNIALEIWRKPVFQEIDLFLLDGLVPHGDSLKLCADLRRIEPDKPIVFYSGLAYKADIMKGLEAGATAYLTKPYSGDLAEEILRYIYTATHIGSIAPLFVKKENAAENFTVDNAQISESPGRVDQAGNLEQFGRVSIDESSPARQSRRVRRTGGII